MDCAGHYLAVDSVGLPREYRVGGVVSRHYYTGTGSKASPLCVRAYVCVCVFEGILSGLMDDG